VTGAARGIGAAIAERLCEEGAAVIVADTDTENLQVVADGLADRGYQAAAQVCDVTSRASVAAAVARAAAEFGRLDVLFNNAGISQVKPIMEVTEEEWERVMRVNALGVLLGIQEGARQMIAQGQGGKIINTASIAGKQGFPLFPHYSASKFAVVALTQAAARALAAERITVNAFCPGVVGTKLWEQLDSEFIELGQTTTPGEAINDFAAGILLGRVSEPGDIVGLAAFLASGDADYITGQSIQVDGGMVLE
jgi:meso-butanediol dehydrogenase/(S,S)-butanediol dehydrogenase/diacetyl reductase